VVPAFESIADWAGRVRTGFTSLLALFDREPSVAYLCIVESLAAGPVILEYPMLVVGRLTSVLDEGCAIGSSMTVPPPLAGEAAVGAVLHVLHGRLVECGRTGVYEPLGALVNPLRQTRGPAARKA
jgi:hypothetical protein